MLVRFFGSLAQELVRVDERGAELVTEAYPRTTVELLPDWERVTGLPDPCNTAEQTTAERQAALQVRLTARGGQSRAYFIGLAATLGFDITITEFEPADCTSACDSTLWTDEATVADCESACNASLRTEGWRFVWQVNAPAVTVFEADCTSACNDPLRWWGNSALECLLRRLSPAHTFVLFSYAEG